MALFHFARQPLERGTLLHLLGTQPIPRRPVFPMAASPTPPAPVAPEILDEGLRAIAQAARTDARLLAAQPHAWQEIAHALGCRNLRWYRPAAAGARVWNPNFRVGSNRQLAADALVDLAKKSAAPDSAEEAMNFLLCQFSGEALARLRAEQQSFSKLLAAQSVESWWGKTPAKSASGETVRSFAYHDVPTTEDARFLSGALLPRLAPWLDIQQKKFAEMDGALRAVRSDDAGTGAGHFFAVGGRLHLDAALQEPLRGRLAELTAQIITTVGWAEQENGAAVARHLEKKVAGEMLHASHAMLGGLQESLLGSLVLAGFPLLYWHDATNSAKSVAEFPAGRRQDFTEPECGAFWEILGREAAAVIAQLTQEPASAIVSDREKFLSHARIRVGRLAFAHISLVRIFAWLEALPPLLDHPLAQKWSWGRCRAELQEDVRCFQQIGERLRSLFHLILAKNSGLAGTIHATFMRKNPTFQTSHDSRDVASLVREELLKAAASFDYATGVRFSTYAMNRINFELRRRPHQERQLIKLSSDQTTAQPRIWQLALSSDLLESDPNFHRDLSDRYNARHTGTGRAPMTPSQAADLLRVGHVASLSPAKADEGDEHPALDIPVSASEISPAVMAEIGECVRAILQNFAPGEELALSLLLKVSPPRQALQRFNRDLLDDAERALQRVIAQNSSANSDPSQPGASGRRVRLTPGQLSEKINPKKKT